MSESLREIYNHFADTYESNRGAFDITDILDEFYSLLNRNGGALLDLGCGAGEPVARYFLDRNWRIEGVDFSERMLELASNYVPEMKTIRSDIRAVEFMSDSFDAITATYSLFHIPADHQLDLFSKMYGWLKPNGRVLFTYATKEYTGEEKFDGYKMFMGRKLYYSHKRPDELYRDLESIGFHIESKEHRCIANETFLWVTVAKPAS